MPNGKPGGLSGAFLPIRLRYEEYPPFVTVSVWGMNKSLMIDNIWSQPARNPPEGWSSLGYLAGLDPYDDSSISPVRIFGFSINRLPRHMTRLDDTNGLVKFQLELATSDPDSGKTIFKEKVL
jgi:hypothetical protein